MKYLFVLLLLFSPSFAQANDDYKEIYKPASYINMSNLMWVFDEYDPDDHEKLDTWLQITECPMFKQYYRDDFKWQIIREGVKRDLKMFKGDMPTYFYVNAFVPLGRYNFEKAAFEIDQEFAANNAGQIRIPFYSETPRVCGNQINTKIFPRNIKFFADNKFSLDKIPMAPDEATALLERLKGYRYEGVKDTRIVPLQFRIQVKGVKEYIMQMMGAELVYEGTLNEIVFFEDPQLSKVLWRKKFREGPIGLRTP